VKAKPVAAVVSAKRPTMRHVAHLNGSHSAGNGDPLIAKRNRFSAHPTLTD
jgi:hypothetical protein